MALTHLAFMLLIVAIFEGSEANKTVHNNKTVLDPKRRSNAVDETFLEQKDILLDMLESKLKEVRDKKKRKAIESRHQLDSYREKCESLLKNVDVKVKINGISAVGDADFKLNYGNSSKGIISINANGISNVGQANVELGVGANAMYIPGLSNLFVDAKLLDCVSKTTRKPSIYGAVTVGQTEDTRRVEDNNELNNTPLSEITPTTASRIFDIVMPSTSTPNSFLLGDQSPLTPSIAPGGDIVPVANQLTIPQAIPQDSPQAMIQSVPQVVPQALPQAVPQSVVQAMPQVVPQAAPQAVPQAIPQAVPQAVPQILIQTVPPSGIVNAV